MNSHKSIYKLSLLCSVLLLASALHAQIDMKSILTVSKQEKVKVDFGVFALEDSRQVRLEVYYQVHNNSLTFEPQDDVFKAAYEIEVTIMDRKGRRLAGENQEKSVTVSSLERAESYLDYRTSQINFSLDPGRYEVEFKLHDKNSNNEVRRDFDAKLKKLNDKNARMSRILFAQAAGQLQGEADQFSKGDLTVIPSLSHLYGGEEESRLMYYMEIYPGTDDMSKVTVQTLLRHKKGKMIYRDTLTTVLDSPIVRQLREISLVDFAPGEYELEIKLLGRRGKKLDEEKGTFHVRWSEESLLEHSFEIIVRQIAIVAGSKEISLLNEAETLEEKKQALEDYWKSKDPFPETPVNELKVEFYRRVRLANDNFSYLSRPGWKTDRGKVLIRYGYPDQIEDFPFSLDTFPYQEWHYYRGGRYRRFTFVDDNHDGDYRLIYPYDGLGQRRGF